MVCNISFNAELYLKTQKSKGNIPFPFAVCSQSVPRESLTMYIFLNKRLAGPSVDLHARPGILFPLRLHHFHSLLQQSKDRFFSSSVGATTLGGFWPASKDRLLSLNNKSLA